MSSNRKLMSLHNGMVNAIRVKEWREKVVSLCENAVSDEDMLTVRKFSRVFSKNMHENESSHNSDLDEENWIQRCPFVFLDLGSGAGDAVGEFIDSGLEGCRRSDEDTLGFDPMHFDVDSGKFKEVSGSRKGERNVVFTDWVRGVIVKFYPGFGPEDYCVYGVEPNPLVKPDLVKLERHVNRMDPRPLRHLHFLTEVAMHSEENARKEIFIDSVRNDEKYPGSSLFQSHRGVRESIAKFEDTFMYSVDTVSLSSLMTQTLSFYHDDKDSKSDSTKMSELEEIELLENDLESKSRQHLIIYFDVEGSEFHVLNEAVDSGVLCDFVKDNDNRVDIFIDYHSPDIMNLFSVSAKRFIDEIRPKLLSEECGGDNLSLEEQNKFFE